MCSDFGMMTSGITGPTIGECSSAMAAAWKGLSDEEKSGFNERARRRKEGDVPDGDKWKEIQKSMHRISQEV